MLPKGTLWSHNSAAGHGNAQIIAKSQERQGVRRLQASKDRYNQGRSFRFNIKQQIGGVKLFIFLQSNELEFEFESYYTVYLYLVSLWLFIMTWLLSYK